MVIKLMILAIATEAAVELWKKAAPLQGIREWAIRKTPYLYSERQQSHLLECPYCLSVWGGMMAMAAFFYMDSTAVLFITGALATQRLSNFLHLCFSFLRDQQMDLRVARNVRAKGGHHDP